MEKGRDALCYLRGEGGCLVKFCSYRPMTMGFVFAGLIVGIYPKNAGFINSKNIYLGVMLFL